MTPSARLLRTKFKVQFDLSEQNTAANLSNLEMDTHFASLQKQPIGNSKHFQPRISLSVIWDNKKKEYGPMIKFKLANHRGCGG
jgi:hypothetical protein